MAEIRLEKKKRPMSWIFFSLGICIIVAYFLVTPIEMNQGPGLPENGGTAANGLIELHEYNSIVASYITFIKAGNQKMSMSHAFIKEAIIKLAAATHAMAVEAGYMLPPDLGRVKNYADMIANDPLETTHADSIRKACDILTVVLLNIQKEKYPELNNEAVELRIALESINASVLTLNQKEEIKTFFRKAADLLQKMN